MKTYQTVYDAPPQPYADVQDIYHIGVPDHMDINVFAALLEALRRLCCRDYSRVLGLLETHVIPFIKTQINRADNPEIVPTQAKTTYHNQVDPPTANQVDYLRILKVEFEEASLTKESAGRLIAETKLARQLAASSHE